MKALTIKQPWADAIAYGGKHTENRRWPAPSRAIGGHLLIHAGRSYDLTGRLFIGEDALADWPGERGAVIAIATLTRCHEAEYGCCSPWGEAGVWHWHLTNVRPLTSPVPCSGALRLWNPSSATEHAVTADLNRAS